MLRANRYEQNRQTDDVVEDTIGYPTVTVWLQSEAAELSELRSRQQQTNRPFTRNATQDAIGTM